MIVKVQIPLFSTDPFAPALVYDKTRKQYFGTTPVEELPDAVRNAVLARGGKAYFKMAEDGDLLIFGDEVETQDW